MAIKNPSISINSFYSSKKDRERNSKESQWIWSKGESCKINSIT
jgi:hypothetical protein